MRRPARRRPRRPHRRRRDGGAGARPRRSTRAGDRARRARPPRRARRRAPGDAFADADAGVRRRAVELAAKRPRVDLRGPLADPDASVVEVAAWACGEHEVVPDDVLATLVDLAGGRGSGGDPLVREAAVAALGAIGDDRGLDAILAATTDRPAIRRRAVLALAPFVDPDHHRAAEVAAALERATADRDWQVRQAAEDVDRLQRVAVDVRLAALEADALVEPVGGLARRAARQADVLGAAPAGLVERGAVERLADALAGRGLVDDDVLDPRLQARRDAVEGQRERADDAPVDAGEEQHARRASRRSPPAARGSGGGDDDDSCGISRSNAATSSSSTTLACSIVDGHGSGIVASDRGDLWCAA